MFRRCPLVTVADLMLSLVRPSQVLSATAERGGEPLVRAAVRVHNADILGRVVDVLDDKV